ATLALIRITFAVERERNVAIGVWAATATVGMALGPIVCGALLERFWWGSVFLINVPLVIAASVLIIAVGPPNVANAVRRWDAVSSATALVCMGAAVLALKTWAELPVDYPVATVSSAVGVVVLALFTRRQLRLARTSEPLVDFAIFSNRGFSGGVVAAAI